MQNALYSKIAFWLSAVAVVAAGYVSLMKTDLLGLAGTQWALIGIILAIWALYTKE